jgi:hypothetical protein
MNLGKKHHYSYQDWLQLAEKFGEDLNVKTL